MDMDDITIADIITALTQHCFPLLRINLELTP